MSEVVTVIDYGVGNLFSVRRALEHCGATVNVVSDPDRLKDSTKVLLPGVGAFADAMGNLAANGMHQAIIEFASSGRPLMGICLGMQLLLDSSCEHGHSFGLGLIPGAVEPIPTLDSNGQRSKVPHIGWSSLTFPSGRTSWEQTPLASVNPESSAVYFVHSYMAVPTDPSHRIANCQHDDTFVAAVIGHNNVWGAQFHPEKSGKVGLSILSSFVAMQ
ncbi:MULTISPECIES: imidazole glycerol phosphate synthase subunit HisH [Pseudomonas]|uniref:imidazole glycerol phosphate synthase subunit HisH n=1 Tax=Pseudomonas TaxID=286 RepID=UPI0005C1DB47|nr:MULTISPECIES: imidazole glycerol phosphate synthase subunit HisH [Pseudomonas]KIU49064.1 imidazole glycerol phosphate synthase [Pseudomonas putida]MCP8347230.1 imidazole glycerol phosphate synthase subunit HisH [Pseudomonas sp. FBF18]MCS5515950.1 imidazole glycerol phosphate synthase subunit HisH [Pseudomonas qingdaonensis]